MMLDERTGLFAILVHGVGLLIKLGFLLALMHYCSSDVVGYYGLLAAIDLIVIYVSGLEFHTFTSRRYSRRPSPSRMRFCVACHRRILRISVPLAAVLAVGAALLLGIKLSAAGFFAVAVIVGSGAIVQEIMRVMVLVGRPVHSLALGLLRTTGWQPFAIPFLQDQVHVIDTVALFWGGASLLATAWGAYAVRETLGWRALPSPDYLRAGVARAWRYYLTGSAAVLQGNIERFVLQLFLGPATVGVFVFFQTIANTLPALLQSAVLNVGLPGLLVDFGQKRPSRMSLLKQLCARCLWTGLPLAVVIMLVTWPLLTVVSEGKYDVYFWVLPVLIAAQLMIMTTQPIHLALYAAHRDSLLMWFSLASLAGATVLAAVMVSELGFVGAIAAPVVVSALVALVRFGFLRYFSSRGQL